MKYKYALLGFIGLGLWIGETWYFGWNKTPENGVEAMLDNLSSILILWGIIGDITTNLTIKKDTIVNTQNTYIQATKNETNQ